jgi:hypothetical protein
MYVCLYVYTTVYIFQFDFDPVNGLKVHIIMSYTIISNSGTYYIF